LLEFIDTIIKNYLVQQKQTSTGATEAREIGATEAKFALANFVFVAHYKNKFSKKEYIDNGTNQENPSNANNHIYGI